MVEPVELLFTGWVFGVLTCFLYIAVAGYRETCRRNRRHKDLLDAGVDPLTILQMDQLKGIE